MSHISLTYHLVFSTHNRLRTIPMDHEREMYKFLFDFSKARGVKIWRIGGMPDHVHILCDIPPKISVADYVKLVKAETSKFMRANPNFPNWEKWAEGYGAFSVDVDSRQDRIRYIMTQKEHHGCRSFDEEYMDMLLKHGIDDSLE